jgi:hypothetical protein
VPAEVYRDDLILNGKNIELLAPKRPITSPTVHEDERGVTAPADIVRNGDAVRRVDGALSRATAFRCRATRESAQRADSEQDDFHDFLLRDI